MRKVEMRSERVLRLLRASVACVLLVAPIASAQSPKIVKLECEGLSTPLGMDTAKPLLSWKIQDSRAGARQTAYEIQVASTGKILSTGKADVWDSGRVESDNSTPVQYGGPALEPSKRYYWRVTVWDENGKAYPRAIRAGGKRDSCSRKTGKRNGSATRKPKSAPCANPAQRGSQTQKWTRQKLATKRITIFDFILN